MFLWCQHEMMDSLNSAKDIKTSNERTPELLQVLCKKTEEETEGMGNRNVGDGEWMNEHNVYIHSTLYMAQNDASQFDVAPNTHQIYKVGAAMQTQIQWIPSS